MKAIHLFIFCCLSGITTFAQNAKDALNQLYELEDQRGIRFNSKLDFDELIILSVPTTNEPFRVYDQLRNVKFKPNVFVVGGFENPGGHGAMGIGHLKDGFGKKYGKDYLSVWLDPKSTLAKALDAKGHAIVTISKKKGRVVKKNDFGNKIDDFMKAIEEFKVK